MFSCVNICREINSQALKKLDQKIRGKINKNNLWKLFIDITEPISLEIVVIFIFKLNFLEQINSSK